MENNNEVLIKLIEIALKMRGIKGYGAGHPIPVKNVKQLYGLSDYEAPTNKNSDYEFHPVEVSRAFKRGKNEK